MDPRSTARDILLELGFTPRNAASEAQLLFHRYYDPTHDGYDGRRPAGRVARVCLLEGYELRQAITDLKRDFGRALPLVRATGQSAPEHTAFRALNISYRDHDSVALPMSQGVALAALGVFETDGEIREWLESQVLSILQPQEDTFDEVKQLTQLIFLILDAHEGMLQQDLENVFHLALEFGDQGTWYNYAPTAQVDVRALVLGIRNRDQKVFPIVSRWFKWNAGWVVETGDEYKKTLRNHYQFPHEPERSLDHLEARFIYQLLLNEVNAHGYGEPPSFFFHHPRLVQYVQRPRPNE